MFWERNKGVIYVLAAQVFAVLMNLTTRLLELEGNHGAGMHPFQVSIYRISYSNPINLRLVRYYLFV